MCALRLEININKMLLGYIDTAWEDKPKIKVTDSCYTASLEASRTTEMILL